MKEQKHGNVLNEQNAKKAEISNVHCFIEAGINDWSLNDRS